MASRTAAAAAPDTSRRGSRTSTTVAAAAPELQMASRTAATTADGIEDSDGGGGSRALLPCPLSHAAAAAFLSAPSRGCLLHATLARHCAPTAASLALYSCICEASPPTPFTFSLLLAALASSSSLPPSPSAGLHLTASCLAHAQAFKCDALAHPIVTPLDGAMEIAGVCNDCACARVLEVHRQEEYVVAGRRRPCR
uniref:Uncharacterized protein n=1 Tax=Oryza meridionalis TaxID=40149 RepID=A0A0E0DND6_9ORYZ